MEFSIGIKMGRAAIFSLWISLVCLSEAIVHFVQEIVKSSRGKITGLFFYSLDSDYIAKQTKLGFS